MLKIGLSACFMYPDPTRVVFGHKSLTYMENDMARFVARDGVLPVLIPDLPAEQLHSILEQLDGIVFQGGADLCPETYGEPYLDKERWPGDKHRDCYELALADFFFKKGCRYSEYVEGFNFSMLILAEPYIKIFQQFCRVQPSIVMPKPMIASITASR